MKKLTLFAIATAFLFSATTIYAGTYPSSDGETQITVAGCTLVTTPAEADSSNVYTLNPDHTILLNNSYFTYWGRNARCDELQFHVDHSTSISRLNSWLKSVVRGWFSDIGNTHYANQTVSTLNHEWFFIKEGVARRIPDILTSWSWGLLVGDRISIPRAVQADFYELVTIGAPMEFSGGQYSEKINSIWMDGNRDYSSLPESMSTIIDKFVESKFAGSPTDGGIFERCTYASLYSGDPWRALLDWSWMARNVGCALAPTA
ncbi:hypothetical protein IID19_03445 [Patescibacteria group bacterium]|nr:hypothetical protein [Patescibacteria group bacterium]